MTIDAPSEQATPSLLETRWDAAMEEIYDRAGHEVGYWAGRFLQMLRSRGGVGTAHYILHTKATTAGYARLRAAGRLDLTVEAYALHPEFEPLFSAEELELARTRLAYFERMAETDAQIAEPAPRELVELLADASAAPLDRRHEYRDRVAAFGPRAIPAVEAWVAEGNSAGFAFKVFEAVGRLGDRALARDALRRLKLVHPELADLIDLAIAGLRG